MSDKSFWQRIGLAPETPRQPLEKLPWPSQEEVVAARDYKERWGNPNEQYIAGQSPYPEQNSGAVYPGTQGQAVPLTEAPRYIQSNKGIESIPRRGMTGPEADNLYAGQLAAQRSPLGYVGFDANRMAYSPEDPDSYLTVAGLYRPGVDRMWYDQKLPSSSVHESFHRALKRLSAAGSKTAKEVMETDGLEETLVRAMMLRHHGEVEGQENSKVADYLSLSEKERQNSTGVKQIGRARKAMKDSKSFMGYIEKLEQDANELIASENLQKHPIGLGYAKGGEVINPKYKDVADHLATKGRYGDSMLVHMNKHEVAGLASMVPGGKLTINPDTGQPEAFLPFLLPLLGGLAGGAFLPGAVAGLGLGTISATLGGALGAGAASTVGGLIEGKDIGTSLGRGVASGLLSYGLGSAVEGLAGAGEAASGAGEAAAGATPALGSGAEASLGGVQDWVPMGGMGDGAASAATQAAPETFKYANIDQAIRANATPQGIGGMMDRYGDAAKNMMNPDALKSTFIDNFSSTALPIGLGLYGSGMMEGGGEQGGAPPPQRYYGPATTQGTGRRYTPKEADPLGYEQSYFQYADGGEVNDEEYTDYKKWVPTDTMRQHQKMSLKQAEAYKRALDDHEEKYGKMESIKSPNPLTPIRPSIGRYAGGGGISGPGGGLDDAIPAIIDGRQPAQLSSGEYVIPAHAVSGLGNGSSEEGIRQLDKFVDRVMMAKHGTKDRQPRPVKGHKLLPA